MEYKPITLSEFFIDEQLESTEEDEQQRRSEAYHRLLAVLTDKKPHSNIELAQRVGIRYGARIHEAREIGITIKTTQDLTDRGIFWYSLEG